MPWQGCWLHAFRGVAGSVNDGEVAKVVAQFWVVAPGADVVHGGRVWGVVVGSVIDWLSADSASWLVVARLFE